MRSEKMSVSFEFCSLHYLNQWITKDRIFNVVEMKMKRNFFISVFVITLLSYFTYKGVSYAKTFCVSDTTELQDSLTTASSNGEDNTIQIVQGTYVSIPPGFVGEVLAKAASEALLEIGPLSIAVPRKRKT